MKLEKLIRIEATHSRSINVEASSGVDGLSRYIPTGRALEVLTRIAESLQSPQGGKSFSLVGPYGSGKSSFAVFLSALLGNKKLVASETAWGLLRKSDPAINRKLNIALSGLKELNKHFVAAIATAQREPVSKTIHRAILSGVNSERKGSLLNSSLQNAIQKKTCSTDDLLLAITEISQKRPLLIVVDEFGKNLESFADEPGASDLFLLQQIAELAQNETQFPIVLLTLQHLSFNEYVTGINHTGRKELSKVQGRFEEIPYNDSPEQYRRLISEVFKVEDKVIASASADWYRSKQNVFKAIGHEELLADTTTVRTFPLHPVSVLCLPELCSRFGQNERTLFTFLTSSEAKSVRSYAQRTSWEKGDSLPFVRLDFVYDYFVKTASNLVGSAELASRLVEIETRVRDTLGLEEDVQRVLKTIGVLNLIASGGEVRASKDFIAFAVADCLFKDEKAKRLRTIVESLEQKGLITFRDFADEYRIWSGSDFPLRERLALARSESVALQTSELLGSSVRLTPLIASRHSQKHGVLRAFDRAFADQLIEDVAKPGNESPYDGSIVYWAGKEDEFGSHISSEGRPVLAVIADKKALSEVRAAAVEAYAVARVLTEARNENADWVAFKELAERKSFVNQRLLVSVELAWGSKDAKWRILNGGEKILPRHESTSRLLSEICEEYYSETPLVKNETIARRILTAQGARARRIIAEGVISSSEKFRFGIEGHGPERSIYDAIFEETGLHRRDPKSEKCSFDFSFKQMGSWSGVSEAIAEFLENSLDKRSSLMELSIVLQNPPIGIKEGLVNLLMLSVLKANGDAILLYEHGSLIIDMDDAVAERLLRNPSHFAIKNLQSSGGKNTDLVMILGNRLAVIGEGSKATLLDVARKIYREIQSLPAYSLQSTMRFSSEAVEVRKAIKSASELDVLLFTALPAALGVSDLSEQSSVSKKVKDDFADKLFDVLEELKSSYDNLLTYLTKELSKELQRPGFTVAELREELRNSAGQLKGRVLEKKLNAFVHGIYRDDLAEKEWIANLAMIIAGGQPAKIWTDETLTLFDFSVKEVCGAFFRLNQLLFHSLESRTPGAAMYRVTVTDQAGKELIRTVSATHSEVASARKIVDDAISEVAKIVRSDARSAELIMAILGGAGSELTERLNTSHEKDSDGTQG